MVFSDLGQQWDRVQVLERCFHSVDYTRPAESIRQLINWGFKVRPPPSLWNQRNFTSWGALLQTARVVHSFVDGEGLVSLWTVWSEARFLPSHFQSKPVGTVPSGLAGVACHQTGQLITGQGVQPTSLGDPYSPPPCLSCTDFEILLLVWGSLVVWPQQWGIFRFLPGQKKIENSSHPLSNIQSSVKPKRSVQLQTLSKLCLCLLYVNVTEVRVSRKGAGRTGCPYVCCGRGFTLVNFGVMKRMTPRLAHPFLISKAALSI